MILSTITLFFTFCYSIFIFWCFCNWRRIKDKSGIPIENFHVKVEVVIPVRNEERNMEELLNSLHQQNYPAELVNFVIVDDHSTDQTVAIFYRIIADKQMMNATLVTNPGNSKKDALAFAINQSKADFIITTDADTFRGSEWISSIVREWKETGAYLICCPVKLCSNGSLAGQIQAIEFSGLSGISAAGIFAGKPMFCNGANLAFPVNIFRELKGYQSSKSSSGDDTQLLRKVADTYPEKISFLKDQRAMVETNVVGSGRELWQQRKRWASKIPMTLSPFTVLIAVLAWSTHALLMIQLCIFIFIRHEFLIWLPWALKIISEWVFLKSAGKFFNQRVPVLLILIAEPIYAFYITMVGIFAPIGKFSWKERRVR